MACFITAMVIMYTMTMDRMYMLVALQTRVAGIIPPVNWLQESYEFHKWVTVVLMLAWCAIAAVKFSFLLFFKKLISQVQGLNIFWWVTVVFNIGALGYGVAVYYVACPYYYDPRWRKCNRDETTERTLTLCLVECPYGAGKKLLLSHAISQIVTDVTGDCLSKFCIPQRNARLTRL